MVSRSAATLSRLCIAAALLVLGATALSQVTGATSAAAVGSSVSPSPTQRSGSVYVTNRGTPGGDDVSQYGIGSAGDLFPLNPPTVGTDFRTPMFLAVTPDGTSVYVTSSVEDTILQYAVDPSSGALRPKRPPAVAVARGTEPLGIAVTPNGKSAYVAAFNNDVVQYNIDLKTGALSPKSPPTVAIGGLGGPVTVAVTPDGKSGTSATRVATPSCSTTSTQRRATCHPRFPRPSLRDWDLTAWPWLPTARAFT